MKIYINRNSVVGPWGGGAHWINAMHELTPKFGHSICDLENEPNILLAAGIDPDQQKMSANTCLHYKWNEARHGKKVKVFLRVNDNDARKGTNGVDAELIRLSEFVDGTIFVSEWLKDYFDEKGWKCKNNTVIVNGVDKEIFKPGMKMNNGRLNIVAHHWSNNPMKGFDIYDALDEWVGKNPDVTFTYVGRERGTFKNSTVVPPLSGKKLGDELSKHDLYVSASRHDPGPNHVIESISCGLPTYVHVDGGGAVEFAGSEHSFSTFEEFISVIERAKKGMFTFNTTTFNDWKHCVEKFVRFMDAG
jgi:hypothetical protein